MSILLPIRLYPIFWLTVGVSLSAFAKANEGAALTSTTETAASDDQVLQSVADFVDENRLTEESLERLCEQTSADARLSKDTAQVVESILWAARKRVLLQEREQEMRDRSIVIDGKTMPFWFKTFGEMPTSGRSLFISMHGGGGAPAQVNDRQYENQKRLYQPKEGIYLVPRAPTNTWNLWHESHIDQFFQRLIANMVVFENVDPDRVYIMGYSAGGDGVFQLAPRLSDRFAAAAMMAGHPNETKPDGLRNLPFTLHMGALDGAYNRNRIAGEWKKALAELHRADPEGYIHEVELHSGRGHWMNLEDRVAVPWMAGFRRNRFPEKIVWLQDDVTHLRSYWLEVPSSALVGRPKVVARRSGNVVTIDQSDVDQLSVLFHDNMLDMDQRVMILKEDKCLFDGVVPRTVRVIASSLLQRDDPGSIVYGKVDLKPAGPTDAVGTK